MKTVYLHYDQAALDTEYDNRKKVPNHGEWLSRYAAESARTRTDFEARLDVPFGTHAGERLDVFPARAAGAPVHVFIHGGYWQWLDKSDFSFVARGLQPEGAAVVVINYARGQADTPPEGADAEEVDPFRTITQPCFWRSVVTSCRRRAPRRLSMSTGT